MKILIFSWRDPKHPLAGGAEQVMHEHAKGWIKAGHSVTHFSSKSGRLLDSEVIEGVKLVRYGHQYIGVQLAGFFYYFKNRNNFDLVVDEFHGIPFFTPLFVRKPKLAVIQETARKVWFLNVLPWPLNWIVGVLGYLCEPMIFLFYKKMSFMTGSETAKRDVIKMGIPKGNIAVIPHGVIIKKGIGNPPTSLRAKREKGRGQTICYLGVLSKDKGIEDALECFSILSRMGEYKFWVIGKPETVEYGKKIYRIAKKISLKGNIKFWGFVSQAKKFELLSKAHILVNPSVHEGWGLVNIEANAVGAPVVAYNVSGSVDSVKDGVSGLICKENTPDDLAKNVAKIFDNDKLYKKLQDGAISWSKNFSWEKSRKLSLKLIRKISNPQ